MRDFVLFESSPGKLARFTQFFDIVIGNPADRHCDAVFESQVCVDVP
jgi:hypothetical protein